MVRRKVPCRDIVEPVDPGVPNVVDVSSKKKKRYYLIKIVILKE